MRCAFCNIETDDKFKRGNVILIAHFWCLEDRMTELDTADWIKCLIYEDEIREYSG